MPGAGLGFDFAYIDRLVALVADDLGAHVVATTCVVQHEWGAFGAGEPFVAPGGHGGEDGIHLTAFLGESVLVANRAFLVGDAVEQAVVNEPVQVRGENVAADAQRDSEVFESAGAEACLSDDEKVPAIAEDVRAARHGARPARRVGTTHI